jgi:acyl dehydratase
MKLFLDSKNRRFVKSAASNVALQTLVLKRRDQVPLEVVFVENGVAIDPPAGTQTTVALKSSFSDSNFLSLAAPGTNTLDLYTAPVEAAFSSSDPASIAAFLEVKWTAPSQALRTATLQVEVQNSVILGTEGTPAAVPDGKATQAEAEAGTDNTKWMTPLRTAQAIAAFNTSAGIGFMPAPTP